MRRSRTRYTEDERLFLKENAYGHSRKEIADMFNEKFSPPISEQQVADYVKYHKIPTGRRGKFVKGEATRHVPVGGTRISYHYGVPYEKIKVAEPNVWELRHVHEWKKHHGELPKGYLVIFLDGDTRNFDIENLRAVSRSVHFYLNRMDLRTNDPATMDAAIAVAMLASKTTERARKQNKQSEVTKK